MSKKIVGVKIHPENGSASMSGHETIYLYETDKDFLPGQQTKILVPTGGRPDVTIVDTNVKSNRKGLKQLKEVK